MTIEPATRDSWKTVSMPESRTQLQVNQICSLAEYERIRLGHIPQEMEDRWFIYLEAGWLYFHRSWTGYCIYQLRLEPIGDSYRVVEAWVNRDEKQYRSNDVDYDLETLELLFKTFLLEERHEDRD